MEAGVDVVRAGDFITYKGWAVDFDPRATYSWRVRAWRWGGDLGWIVVAQRTTRGVVGAGGITPPSYFASAGQGYYCARFSVFRRRKILVSKREATATDCYNG